MSKKDPNDPKRLRRLDLYVGRMARFAKRTGPQKVAAKAKIKAAKLERARAWRERMKANRHDNRYLGIGFGATRAPFDREARRKRNLAASGARATNRPTRRRSRAHKPAGANRHR